MWRWDGGGGGVGGGGWGGGGRGRRGGRGGGGVGAKVRSTGLKIGQGLLKIDGGHLSQAETYSHIRASDNETSQEDWRSKQPRPKEARQVFISW